MPAEQKSETDVVFFDLDGTLTDPKVGITRSIQSALEHFDVPIPSADDLTWCIGPPLHASFLSILGSESRAARAVELYRERYSDVGLFENVPYEGVVEMLAEIVGSQRRLFVATSKPWPFADRIIERFGLRDYFGRVFGAELDGTRSDKGELLRYALKETSVDPTTAVMIGDRKHDIIGAAKNGMAAVGVLYGYGSREELSEAGATRLCKSPKDIADLITQREAA
ncbi:HAD family hydrolase [Tardiphaga sp.]|uniref:HAD family hydrolase n=1 Tax=Tardiphaga sp. TaxID=1926292 RepID=UPI00260CC246|nr:HAD family hydrolase [Tardiphaga sp.]MDB5619768.1 family hydrolase [Tardiphaga sp.]